ncbi:hypothetical protein OG204_17735 [Streptomyces sp. NBC_01387]|uniref:hypothetical protein n=1 Tax=Streptomyces sp. NBC_01387 TaxID=2903849 RepID=UPI00324C4A6E
MTEHIGAPPALEVQREEVARSRRGHERLVAPDTGAKAKLTSADRVLATVLHLRKLANMDLLGGEQARQHSAGFARPRLPALQALGIYPAMKASST